MGEVAPKDLVDTLEQRLSLHILLLLYRKGPMTVTELYDALGHGSNTTKGQRVRDLEEIGLIARRPLDGRRDRLELVQHDEIGDLVDSIEMIGRRLGDLDG